MAYAVRTPVFEGPLELLLNLVTAEQVDLWEISISGIVDAYLDELSRLDSVDLEVATELVLVAATLVQLKCRRLLPGPEVEMDEDLGLWEERDLLLGRLLECTTFKAAAQALSAMIEEAARSLPRTAGMEEAFAGLVPDLLVGITPGRLARAFERVVAPREMPRVDVSHLAPVTTSVAEAAAALVEGLVGRGTLSFRELTRGATARLEVVVAFLAVLELYKDGLVELDQAATFGELLVTWVGGVPRPAALAGEHEG